MNDLSLRISTGAKKPKNIMSLPPAVITNLPDNVSQNEKVKPFLQAGTASEQLAALNELLRLDADDQTITHLLVIVYFNSEAKHPVKCFLARYITKNKQLQEPFIDLLSSEILLCIKDESSSYKAYRDAVIKIGMCLENFNPGTSAVEHVAQTLAPYLNRCFECCLDSVRTMSLSPTEKSIVYSLTHLTLKILLHVITKIQTNDHTILCKSLYQNMRKSLDLFLLDGDMPMDTMSVCGLVALALDAYRYDELNHDAWRHFLNRKDDGSMTDEGELAMLAAITTTVPMDLLQEKQNPDDLTPVELLVQKLMDIVEECSTNGVIILSVARTLCRLSKSLRKLEVELGVRVSERLLEFVWSHLEHYLDSVRHQAAELLASTVQYCAQLEIDGVGYALSSALSQLSALGAARRGYHAAVRGLARVLPASRLLAAVVSPRRLLAALLQPELASTVSYTLEDLLTRHSKEVDEKEIYEVWVESILDFISYHDLPPQTITTLENLLDKAMTNQDLYSYVLPHVQYACSSPEVDLKNVLVLLSVARPSLVKFNFDRHVSELWAGVLPYEVLKDAVVDARDEVRVTGLTLVCKGGARTPTRAELGVLRHYLAYCGGEPPHARQLARPMLAKFVKRLLDAKRNGRAEFEINKFSEELRDDCYNGLSRGASLARRATSLELLLELAIPGLCSRSWNMEHVQKLLMHLDDSYEVNKRLAVKLLCHSSLLVMVDSPMLQMEDIISSARSLRPAECATAAARMQVFRKCLPERLLQHKGPPSTADPVLYSALSRLLSEVSPTYDALRAPRDAPTYGLLQCIATLLEDMDPGNIVGDKAWHSLVVRTVGVCRAVLAGAAGLVASAAPEGSLPYSDYGNDAGITLEDGRPVTAQMVLLCAWRTVKEATGILGTLGEKLCLPSIGAEGLCSLAELLATVLANARHRGAFEQAYVAFERVVSRMWRSPEVAVCSWPRAQLAATLAQLPAHLADRRSAGLPFLIQALVSTEPGAGGPGTALRDVMTTLLARAGPPGGQGGAAGGQGGANDRAHACNVLRALYRDSSLDSAVQSYVGDGLRVALQGFEGATWTERNSSTLLLSALVTRVFGVWRGRAQLAARNRMTGRVFFLRYPQLYDIMLNKLKEASESEEKLLLCPSLYPVLLVLGRLYPSSLEGTESNLKLVSFVPLLVSLARSRVLHTRRLAAAAAAPLIAPHRYVPHLLYLFHFISDSQVEMNFCHGILLQICALLENKPEGVSGEGLNFDAGSLLWLMKDEKQPCWPVRRQLARLFQLLLHRYPETLKPETLSVLSRHLDYTLVRYDLGRCPQDSDWSLAMAACLRLQLQLLPKVLQLPHQQYQQLGIADLLATVFLMDDCDMCEAALDYLLEGGAEAGAAEARRALRARADFLPRIAEQLRDERFWKTQPQRACKQLQFLVSEGDTQELLISSSSSGPLTPDDVIRELGRLALDSRDTVTHLYLESLTSYISPRLGTLGVPSLLSYCVTLHAHVAGAGGAHVACTLRERGAELLGRLQGEDAFPVSSCVWGSAARLLRDPEPEVRALAAAAALRLAGHSTKRSVVPSRASALLLEACAGAARGAALLTALALCGSPRDELDSNQDESRIFEPREQEIALAEEKEWTAVCADKVVDLCVREGIDPLAHVAHTLNKWTLPYLDSNTVDTVKKLVAGENVLAGPIEELFVRKLKREV